ncbi:hypothetical protein DY000_02056788 [Brassica cretica]|uniref:Uncharacterized protein n=1 Tax=Brassica cretica TaxID=69181 RepID=A0ABQ7AB59_BRACR|nr:hypothetical protein DY000_02056788 [Brassica cretica]
MGSYRVLNPKAEKKKSKRLKIRRTGAKFGLFRTGKRRLRGTPSLHRFCFVSLSFGRGFDETKDNLVSWSLRLALRDLLSHHSVSQTPATPSAHLLRRLSGSRPLSVLVVCLTTSSPSVLVVCLTVSSHSLLVVGQSSPSSLSMTPSSVSLRFLPEAVLSVNDSIVCLTPSSRSVHLLCQTVVSLTPSSLSLGFPSRSRV